MKRFAVIGNPIEHSLSPNLHNWLFNHLNIPAKYEKIRVYKNTLKATVQRIGNGELDGINVTIPHKEKIMEYLDEINPRAKAIGAVNCVMRSKSKLIGNNTDWLGFSKAMELNNIQLSGNEVIVLGAGGSSKSILFALKLMGVSKIKLLNRTIEKAKALEDKIITAYSPSDAIQVIKNNSIIINTTSVGMQNAQFPLDPGMLHENQVLIDVIYTPLDTAILKFGNKIGAKTLNGLDMFIYQALASMDLWFGEDISMQVNFPHLKTYLENKLCLQ